MTSPHPPRRSTASTAAILALLLPLAAALPAAFAFNDPLPDEKPAADKPATTQPTADPEPPKTPSAEDILRELSKAPNRPAQPVIPPSKPGQTRSQTMTPGAWTNTAVGPVARRLLPDGYRIVDRPGRLTREADYFVYSFESRGEGDIEAPMRLLPNRLLEDMEQFSEAGTRPIVFIISGEITEYHGVNYLLVQKLLTRPNLGNLKTGG